MFNEDDEIEVCDILLNLGALIHQFETSCPKILPLKWGNKRKRSNKESSSHHHHHNNNNIPITSSQSPLLHTIKTTSATAFQGDDSNDDVVNNKVDKVEAAPSPATPLSFSPSESDDNNKSNHSSSRKKNIKKRSREEWMEIIEGLTQSREVLKGEVENVRSYFKKLKAFNVELKTMKHERLTAIVRQQFPNTEINNLGINIGQHHGPSMRNPLQNNNYVVFDGFHYPKNFQLTQNLFSSFSNCNGNNVNVHVNNNVVRPCGIPDLNASPDEVIGPLDHLGQSLEIRKAMAAEKRMIRRMINIKKKNEVRAR